MALLIVGRHVVFPVSAVRSFGALISSCFISILMPKTKKNPSRGGGETLLAKAEECMDRLECDRALHLCKRALKLEPDNVEAVEMAANIMLDVGDDEGATALRKAIQLNPATGYVKFFSLAQLNDGTEAVELYDRGIDILTAHIDSLPVGQDEEKSRLTRELSSAYCSKAEIFTTDLCFEDNAEQECLSNVEKALAADPENPEAYQSKATYCLIKKEFQEAKTEINKSLSLWLPKMEEENDEPDQSEASPMCPLTYEYRASTVKLLLELEEYESATKVLDTLLRENDEIVDVWYLYGFMNFLRGEEFYADARRHLGRAKKVAAKTGTGDEEILTHMEEILDEMGEGEVDSEEDKENVADGDTGSSSSWEDSSADSAMEEEEENR